MKALEHGPSSAKRALLGARDVVVLRAEGVRFLDHEKKKPGDEDQDESMSSRRSFELVAYSGAEVERWFGRLAVDLAGIEGDPPLAVLLEHDDRAPVGVAESRETTAAGLILRGRLLSNEDAEALAANADEGLPYKCSIGFRLLVSEKVESGVEVQLNGRVMHGPLTIARRSRLIEASFITCDPADPSTSAAVFSREAHMADLATAPAATEQFRAEAAKSARAELRARADELRAAFPDRAQFASDCALDGLTLVESKARLADVLLAEFKTRSEANAQAEATKAKDASGLEALRRQVSHSPPSATGEPARLEAVPAELAAEDASLDRARADFARSPVVRAVFRALPGLSGLSDPVERYAAALRLEARLNAPAVNGFGGAEKNRASLKRMAERLVEGGGVTAERLSSWGRSGPDYADMTVRGYLGLLYRPLEGVLGGSWAPSLGAMIESSQEVETYRWFGQVPQFREWLGSRQVAPLRRYVMTGANRTYEATLLVAIPDFLFEKSGQLAIRFGEMGRRASQHWEKLVSDLILANGLAYDGVAYFATTHTLGGASGLMSNDVAAADVPALNVAVAAAPTVQEAVDAIMGVTAHFYGYLDDKGEPINGDARQFLVMVPRNLWPAFVAAERVQRPVGAAGAESSLQVQDMRWRVVCNPRLTNTTQFYTFREDSFFKPFVLQEATAIEAEFQAAGSALAFNEDAYAFGLKTRRAAINGEWAHAIRATLS